MAERPQLVRRQRRRGRRSYFPGWCGPAGYPNGFNQNTRFHSIAINGPDYAITGEQIFLSAGFVANYSQAGVISQFTPNIILDASQVFSAASRGLQLNGIVNLNGHTLTSAGIGGVTYNVINGSGTLVITGRASINGNSSGFGTTI